MRSSAPSIDRRSGGFTLLEVVIAVSLFAIIIVLALSQIIEATDTTRYATVRADLRRQGELVLGQIVQDLGYARAADGVFRDPTGAALSVQIATHSQNSIQRSSPASPSFLTPHNGAVTNVPK